MLPDIIFSGGLNQINGIMIEFHQRLEVSEARKSAADDLIKVLNGLTNYSMHMKDAKGKFQFEELQLDDESFGNFKGDYPKC